MNCLLYAYYFNIIKHLKKNCLSNMVTYLHTSTYHLWTYRRHILNYNPHVNCTSYRCLFFFESKNPL